MAVLHGCHNKPRDFDGTYTAQAGWSPTFYDGRGAPHRTPQYVEIKSSFVPGCKYDKAATDSGCVGCSNQVGKS